VEAAADADGVAKPRKLTAKMQSYRSSMIEREFGGVRSDHRSLYSESAGADRVPKDSGFGSKELRSKSTGFARIVPTDLSVREYSNTARSCVSCAMSLRQVRWLPSVPSDNTRASAIAINIAAFCR
jgi:hypothetical protein